MSSITATLLIGVAAYRLWRLLALDVITMPIRAWLFNIDPDDDTVEPRFVFALSFLRCPWCLGSWIAAGLTIAADTVLADGVAEPALVGIAAAAVTGMIGSRDPDQMYGDGETG